MAPIVLTIDIDRPPEQVFAYVTEPACFSHWQADVVRVETGNGTLRTPGARFTTTRRIGGAERVMTQEVIRAEPPATWACRGVSGPLRPNVALAIEPVRDGAGSHATFTFDFAGSGAGVALLPLVRRMTARQAPRSLQRLKEILEA